MLFRPALFSEVHHLFCEGYKEWPKNRTFEQYCTDNAKEDAYGTRYVLEVNGEIVSSLILLNLENVCGKKAYGIGSVLTSKVYSGKGYATLLLVGCLQLTRAEDCYIFLFSDIDPVFYKRLNFRELPAPLQKYPKSVCMVYCSDENWCTLKDCGIAVVPDYF